jgi:hypothetical protein
VQLLFFSWQRLSGGEKRLTFFFWNGKKINLDCRGMGPTPLLFVRRVTIRHYSGGHIETRGGTVAGIGGSGEKNFLFLAETLAKLRLFGTS